MTPHVLLLTNLFPNPVEPNRGIFVACMAEQLQTSCQVSVVSPLPWCPRLGILRRMKRWYRFALVPRAAIVRGFRVEYPKFLAISGAGWLHPPLLFLRLLPLVKKIHRQRPVDVINAHWVFPDGVAASWIGRLLKIPVVLSAHGCDINAYSHAPLRRPQILDALRSAERITAVSDAQQEQMKALGVRNGRVQVVHNGVDQTRYRPMDKREARRRLGIPDEVPMLLFVGQFVDVKGFGYLVQAASLLKTRRGERFQVVAVGEGPLRATQMEEVARQGLREQFVFCGERPHEEVAVWMGACDVLCLPSLREGCPTVVVEALACGRPVVATRVGGTPELVREANGVLCEPRDARALAEALLAALERSWDPDAISASVRHLTWGTIAQRYRGAIEEALAASRAGSR